MLEFKKIEEKEKIFEILYDFNEVFPHLMEKVDDMVSYAEKLSEFAEVYIGLENGKNFGISVFYANDEESLCAYISLIGVKKKYKHRGYGSWLLCNTIEKSKENGMVELKLEVDNDNTNAVSFYERNGMSVCGYTDRNSMYMIKKI